MKIEISIGDLVDKVSILLIKLNRIQNKEKLKNIQQEYNLLIKSLESIGITPESKGSRSLVRGICPVALTNPPPTPAAEEDHLVSERIPGRGVAIPDRGKRDGM